jgi:hypothetical protein
MGAASGRVSRGVSSTDSSTTATVCFRARASVRRSCLHRRERAGRKSRSSRGVAQPGHHRSVVSRRRSRLDARIEQTRASGRVCVVALACAARAKARRRANTDKRAGDCDTAASCASQMRACIARRARFREREFAFCDTKAPRHCRHGLTATQDLSHWAGRSGVPPRRCVKSGWITRGVYIKTPSDNELSARFPRTRAALQLSVTQP